ncbi:hypothetical protein EDC02_3578 [Micromonospora sp. Llam0]|nr:hypothetical protein EDC02_3578 [Micromonospora sp. Llam0]
MKSTPDSPLSMAYIGRTIGKFSNKCMWYRNLR